LPNIVNSQFDNNVNVYGKIVARVEDMFYGLAVAVGRQRALHTKAADLPLQLLVDTFPRFVVIGFYFLSETLI
jgi:hypothetical protein